MKNPENKARIDSLAVHNSESVVPSLPRRGRGPLKHWPTVASLLFIALLAGMALGSSERGVKATRGFMDLSDSATRGPVAELSGEWEFYWNKLLDPTSFAANPGMKPDAYFELPSTWMRFRIDGRRLPETGGATLRLKVRHPWKGQEIGIKLTKINFAFKLFADNMLIAEAGAVSGSKRGFLGRYKPQSVYFTPASEDLVLTLQVSNQVPGHGAVPWTKSR